MKCPNCGSINVENGEQTEVQAGRQKRFWYVSLLQLLVRNALWTDQERYGMRSVCRNCGYTWFEKLEKLRGKHAEHLAPLLGHCQEMEYSAQNGVRLRLGQEGVSIQHGKKTVCTIPYDQLVAVRFQENLGPLFGWVTLRHMGNYHKPFPITLGEARKEKTTVMYPLNGSATFRKIYSVLRAITEENKKAGLC